MHFSAYPRGMGDLKLVTAIDRGNGFKLYIFVYGQREAVRELSRTVLRMALLMVHW